MRAWLVTILLALLRWLSPAPVEAVDADPLDRLAAELVAKAEGFRGGSGEYKRHWVYAKLLKAFPDRAKSDCGLAIEVAVQLQRRSR